MNNTEFNIFIKALEFAAEKHRFQKRKDEQKSAYIVHPIQAAALLWEVGKIQDIDILAAALLHDCLEDTATTDEELRQAFGEPVLALVKEVSDDKPLPKDERKRLQLEHAPHASLGAKQIKLVDKISNVREIRENPPASANWPLQRKLDYIEWSKQVVDKIRDANTDLARKFDEEYTLTKNALLS